MPDADWNIAGSASQMLSRDELTKEHTLASQTNSFSLSHSLTHSLALSYSLSDSLALTHSLLLSIIHQIGLLRNKMISWIIKWCSNKVRDAQVGE